MVGALRLKVSNRTVHVELTDDLQWQCDDDEVAELLHRIFPLAPAQTIASRPLARRHLFQAAHRLGGTVDLDCGEMLVARD